MHFSIIVVSIFTFSNDISLRFFDIEIVNYLSCSVWKFNRSSIKVVETETIIDDRYVYISGIKFYSCACVIERNENK